MNLTDMLSGVLMSDDALGAIAKQTGASKKDVKKLLNTALPTLISALTKNASTEKGAQSLVNALSAHTSTKAMTTQIADADTEDGAKIVSHILGDNQDAVVTELAKDVDMDESQVSKSLASIAPGLLSGLSAATQNVGSTGNDFTNLMSMFSAGAGAVTATAGMADLASYIKNGGIQAAMNGEQVQANSASSALGNLVGSLFGGGSSNKISASQVDGTDLLEALGKLMK